MAQRNDLLKFVAEFNEEFLDAAGEFGRFKYSGAE